MPKFKITTEDGTFVVEADSPETATAALEQTTKNNYTGKTDANGVPEGMIFDPATNRMVDAKALAENVTPGGSWAMSAVKGIPFLGEYADEAVGYLAGKDDPVNRPNESQAIQTQVAREAAKTFDENNPKTALASKIGVGLTTLPAAVEFAPAALTQGSILARSILGGTTGATLGGVEGAVSGFGEGEGDDRLAKAKDRATTSALVGGVLGAATPMVVDAATAGTRKLLDSFTVDKQIKDLGIKRPAADTISSVMKADDTLGPEGLKRIANAGDDAMLADAGPTASGLLDTTIQKGNLAGRLAQKAVQDRAAKSSNKLSATMDLVLGKPPGANQAAREIAEKSALARRAAYDLAHSKPIDYATKEGRVIEDVFARTPKSILRRAIKEANDDMVINNQRNQQIMAVFADDGSVKFRQMPNMRQVDELKKALGKIGSEVDDLGRKTPAAVRASRLAKELRNAAMKAVPEYETAVKLGGDKIAEDNALRLGLKLLRPSTTREDVAEAVEDITGPERKQLGLGLRQYIDDLTANVKKAVSDPNQDAREAAAAFREMSSKAAREKMVAALGDERAKPLLKQLDEAEVALGLRADTAANSKTFARTETAKAVEQRNNDSSWQALKEFKPLEAGKRLGRRVTGEDTASRLSREEEVYADIATLLTGPRGQDAQLALQRLEKAYKTGDLNKETARRIGEILIGGADVTAYQFSTR